MVHQELGGREISLAALSTSDAIRLRTLMKIDPLLHASLREALRSVVDRCGYSFSDEFWETLTVASISELYDGQAHVIF